MAKKRNTDYFSQLKEEFDEFFASDEHIEVLPTGALSLDVSTGIGGIPFGRFTEIYGAPGSGKTTLALSIVKQAVDRDLNVLYVDAEQAVNKDVIKDLCGEKALSDEYLSLIRPEILEQALRICELGIKSNRFNVIILDSIASLAPKKVKEDNLTDSNVALLARIFTTFLQRNAYDNKNNNVAFIGINQIRANIGNFFSDVTTPGGYAWEHIISLQVELNISSPIKAGDKRIGMLSRFVVKKNKLKAPYRSSYIPIRFGKGVDSMKDAIDFAKTLGVITTAGPHYYFGDEKLGQGFLKVKETLENNPETLDKIREMCYNVTNVAEFEKDDDDEKES